MYLIYFWYVIIELADMHEVIPWKPSSGYSGASMFGTAGQEVFFYSGHIGGSVVYISGITSQCVGIFMHFL